MWVSLNLSGMEEMEDWSYEGFITSKRAASYVESLRQMLKAEAGASASPVRLFWVLVGFAEVSVFWPIKPSYFGPP